MLEKLKNISNKKIVIVTSIVMLLVLIAGVSYAIWSRSFTQTGTNLSKYDCFDIVYAENVNEVSLSNGYPITDEEGLKAESYDLTIKNTCKILANYEVVLNKLNTSTLNDTNVKIAVDSDISLLSDLKTTNTNLTNATEGKVLTTGVLASGQSKTIKIQSWMDENTTKDIWNDDDGAKEPPKKRRMLRKFLIFLLVLIAVLGLVLVAAWRDGTGFDALRRYFAYGTEAVGGEKTVYRYDTDNTNRFARVGTGSLVILSDTSLRLLGPDGSEVWSANVKMNAPALGQGGGLAVAYDIGGTALYVLDETGPRLELTSDGPLVSANLNGSGMLAVTTQISGTKGHVDVYGADMQVLFAFNAHRRFVADACVTEDGSYLAAVTMGQADSVFISDLVIYDLTQEDPVADYAVPDGLVTAMTGRGDRILTVTDTCLAVGNTAGKLLGTYSYNGEYLREYDLGGEDYTVLQLNRYQSGSVGRLVTVDDDGEEIASLDVAEEVRDVSACGRYLSVLYADRLVVYNRQLQAYATLHGPEHTREVLTRADGSVLMIGADSAELFLP